LKVGAGTCLALGTSFVLEGCGNGDENGLADTVTGEVAVHTILGDELADLYDMGRRAAQALGIHPESDFSGKSVFIKPNFMSMGLGHPFDPHLGECTKAEIVVGIAEQCLRAGADKVTIGDGARQVAWDWSSIVFLKDCRVFGKTDLKEAVAWLKAAYPRQQVELFCLNAVDEWEHIPSSSDHEIMLQGLKIARSFYDADHVISVPVMKTHLMADLSFSMKNLVGVTPIVAPYGSGAFARYALHLAYADARSGGVENAGIAGCFTDILRWRKSVGKEDFAIIDCSIGLEGDGPTIIMDLGKPIDIRERNPSGKYFLLASKDLVAADATASRVANQEPRSLQQLRMAANLGLGEIDRIRIVGDATLEQVRIHDFRSAVQFQPEWGASATVPPSFHGIRSNDKSRLFNALISLSIPTSAIYFL
jgi:uncharacterized protein (DUF362 family)